MKQFEKAEVSGRVLPHPGWTESTSHQDAKRRPWGKRGANRDTAYMSAHPAKWFGRRIMVTLALALAVGMLHASARVDTARAAGWYITDAPDFGMIAVICLALAIGIGASWIARRRAER